MNWGLFAVLLIVPWIATYCGSLVALKINVNTSKRQGALLGFAAGVMVAASVWSLIIPSFEGFLENKQFLLGFTVITLGFLTGCAGMLALDKIVPHQHSEGDIPEGRPSKLSRPRLLVMAVALHNIPEGLALGVVMAAAASDGGMTWIQAIMFSAGLALQNFPEGLAVVFPLVQSESKKRAHKLGLIASFAEPLSASVGFLASALLMQLGGIILPLMLSMAAGSMIFITVEELIPASQAGRSGHVPTYGFLAGFWIMAVLGMIGL